MKGMGGGREGRWGGEGIGEGKWREGKEKGGRGKKRGGRGRDWVAPLALPPDPVLPP